jgi:putative tributyrin esterase
MIRPAVLLGGAGAHGFQVALPDPESPVSQKKRFIDQRKNILKETTTIDDVTVDKFCIFSPCMSRYIKTVVVLPPGYAENPGRRYPVLYALHGQDAPYTTWSEMSPLRQALQTKPMIVVTFDADRASWYLDSLAQSRFTTFFFDECVPFIDKVYRIDACRHMLTGFSMGGFGAMHYLLTRPGQFTSVSSLSGAFPSLDGPDWARREAMLQPLLGGRYAVVDLYSRVRQAVQQAWKLPPVYLHCGTEDSLLDENRTMQRFLKEQGVVCEYLETSGQHDWAFWQEASAGIIDFHWRTL